jgi:hypothetical protein
LDPLVAGKSIPIQTPTRVVQPHVVQLKVTELSLTNIRGIILPLVGIV